MLKQKLIVISMDALIAEDIDYLKDKLNFRWMLENGSWVEQVRSIYPTLTYPCHTTMASGCYPAKHGIVNNTHDIITRSKKLPWVFEHENVRCEDILDAAKKAGLTTAAVGWPVSGNHPSVDYLVNECWPEAGAPIEDYRDAYVKYGTSQELLEKVVDPILWMRVGRKQPQSSYFLTKVSAEIIRNYQPDILLLHYGVVDSYRHQSGVFSDLVTQGLDDCEEMLAMLIQATKDAGVYEKTNFVVTSDHGQMNTVRAVDLNRMLADAGFITLDDEGKVQDWKAWCFTTGMSAQIRLSDPSDKQLYNQVHQLLLQKRQEGVWGYSRVYTRKDVQSMGLDGDFSFVVETDGITKFGDEWIFNPGENDAKLKGSHGFHPDKGPSPTLIGCGPAFRKGGFLAHADLADGAPTYAKILGVELPDVDGRPLTELLV